MPTLKECRDFMHEYVKMTWQARTSVVFTAILCITVTWWVVDTRYADRFALQDERLQALEHPVNFAGTLIPSLSSSDEPTNDPLHLNTSHLPSYATATVYDPNSSCAPGTTMCHTNFINNGIAINGIDPTKLHMDWATFNGNEIGINPPPCAEPPYL